MWWQYIIVFFAIVLSIIYLTRHFVKKVKTPVHSCNCKECGFANNCSIISAPDVERKCSSNVTS